MKKLALFAVIGTFGLVGCGGSSDDSGDDDVPVFVDASPDDTPDSGTPVGDCNAVSQTGCQPGEKCGFILDDPMSGLGHTGCAADGTAALGEACTNPAAAGQSDTCAAGGSCYQGTCHGICTTVNDTCAGGTSCVAFNDIDFDMCLPNCDPIAQDCPGDDACYLLPSGSVCAGVFMDSQPGEACTAANGCTAGAGCFGDPGMCLRYCSLTVCPPQTDEMGNVVAWCGPDADPPCTCAGGAQFSGMECLATESCQGIQGEDVVGVCADLSGG